jgi:hypothetical protein
MKTASSFNRIAFIGAMAVFAGSVSAQDRDMGKMNINRIAHHVTALAQKATAQ